MKPTRSFFSRVLLGVAACAVCMAATFAADAAFTLKVTPIPIVITGGGTSTMVELRNEGVEPLRLEASTFEWSQTAAGEDKLTPTTEILVFPSMVTIPPGKTKKVRVGTQGGYDAREKPFRVIFGELPPNASTPADAEVVKVIARVSVPIFVLPDGAAASLRFQSLTATKDRVRFQLQNSGSAHARVDKVDLKFIGADDKLLGSKTVPGWYVLPGRTRTFDVPLGTDVSCAGAARVVVTASTQSSGSPSATLAQPACAN